MKTLTINFVTSPSAPTYGYKVKYRALGDEDYIIVSPNPTTSPIIITGLADSTTYEGTIMAMCTPYGGSNEVAFTATPS